MTPRSGLLRQQAQGALDQAQRMGVARPVSILIAALVLAIALGVGMVRAGAPFPSALSTLGIAPAERVYRVSDLRRQVSRDPEAWIGRTVQVRGRAALDRTWSAPDSIVTSFELLDPGTPGGTGGLVLARGGANPLLASLRRLPLIGHLVPQPQVLHWGTRATYRVRLRASAARTCDSPPCYEALLLDASPDALGEG